MTQVLTWASLGPGESGHYLVLCQTRGVWSPPGPHLDLVNLVPIWASPSHGDFVHHLDLIAVDTYLASPGTGDSNLSAHHPDLVTLVLTWASLVPGDCSTAEPHLDLKTLEPLWASP